MFVGRREETEAIHEMWKGARGGAGDCITLVGEAGIGKTALLREAARAARETGGTVVWVEGVRGEDDLAWAGVTQLCQQLRPWMTRIEAHHRQLLDVALGADDHSRADRAAVSVALQALVGEATEDAPVLLVVDDLHWLDLQSSQAIVYLARRLAGLRLALLVAARDLRGLDLPDVRRVRGLDRDDTVTLARSVARDQLGLLALEPVVTASGGNPLAVEVLIDSLSDDQRSGVDPLPDPLPIGPEFDSLLASQLDALPRATRRVLAAAAMGPVPAPVGTLLKVAGVAATDIEPGERAGIIAVAHGEARITHPLYRAVAYWGIDAPERRQLHAAWAAHTDDLARRTLHLADASVTPQPDLATTFEDLARSAASRGAFMTACAMWVRARSQHTDPCAKALCSLAAGESALDAGDVPAAREHVADVPDGTAPSRRAAVEAGIAEAEGDVARAVELWTRAISEMDDECAAADRLVDACLALIRRTDFTRLARLLADAPALSRCADSLHAAQRDILTAIAELTTKQLTPSTLQRFGRYPEILALADDELAAHLDFAATAIALPLAFFHQHDAALEVAERCERIAAQRTMPLVAPTIATARALVAFRSDLPGAAAYGAHAVALAEALGRPALADVAHAYLVNAQAMLGHPEVLQFAQAHRDDPDVDMRVRALVTDGAYWVTLGHAERALESFVALHDDPEVDPRDTLVHWQADLGETAVRCGRLDLAAEAVAQMRALLVNPDDHWLAGALARVEGMMAPIDECGEPFARSVAEFELAKHPTAVARSELLWGERLRRARRRAEARTHLERARDLFREVGAGRWMERAEMELLAAGAAGATTDHSVDAERVLTAQELQVARLAVAGESYRDIAARLFVSPRTVESHLSAVYRKLGVKNRAGLSARAAADPALRATTSGSVNAATG